MSQAPIHEDFLQSRLDDICAGLCEAIDREVETLQREGMPIFVSDNGVIVDLQSMSTTRDRVDGDR